MCAVKLVVTHLSYYPNMDPVVTTGSIHCLTCIGQCCELVNENVSGYY